MSASPPPSSNPSSGSGPDPARLPHAWVVYVAALAPAFAIAFAFALGPSPRKRVVELRRAPPERAAAILSELGGEALPALVEELGRPDGRHRVLLAEHLGRRGHGPAAEILDEIARDARVSAALRTAARDALDRIADARSIRARRAQMPGAKGDRS